MPDLVQRRKVQLCAAITGSDDREQVSYVTTWTRATAKTIPLISNRAQPKKTNRPEVDLDAESFGSGDLDRAVPQQLLSKADAEKQ